MFAKYLAFASAAASLAGAAAVPRYSQNLARGAGNSTISSKASSNSTSGFQNVVYWGQQDQEADLSHYCAADQGADIVILSFINSYGAGQAPSGQFGTDCQTSDTCTSLEQQVQQCKQAGKKIFVSIGGYGATGHITSQADGEGVAGSLWSAYGNPAAATDKSINRPLGQQFVDGFDIDVESDPDNDKNDNYKYMINKLRDLFTTDSANTYYISGAPQCPNPEPNMGDMITDSKFDMLFIQFYNNDPCSANSYADGDKQDFNFDSWYDFTNQGASKGAKLFVGVPAGPLGATGDDSGKKYYVPPSGMADLVNEYKSHPGFSGVMSWDAQNSDTVTDGGCSFLGNMRKILDTGAPC